MKIERDGTFYELTAEELERAFREKERQYLCEDAELHFMEFVNGIFLAAYGFTFEDAIDEYSKDYVLPRFVERFMDEQDCNEPENAVWKRIVDEFMKEKRDEMKAKK